MKQVQVLGLGSPLIDLLAQVDDAFLGTVPGEKGGMVMVSPDELLAISSRVDKEILRAPGGSASNTVFALSRLGIASGLKGKLGKDELGRYFRETLGNAGGSADYLVESSSTPTGCCLSLVTPDSERTMRSSLAASLELVPEDIRPEEFDGVDLVHIEGYMFFNFPVVRRMAELAQASHTRISLDLASFEVVGIFREQLMEFIREYVDIVFANEAEAAAFVPDAATVEDQLAFMRRFADCVVIKLGKDGCIVAEKNRNPGYFPAETVSNPVDTTAAGDLFQAGFLYGTLQGWSSKNAAKLGARLGGEVIRRFGSTLPDSVWQAIHRDFHLNAEQE